VPTPAFNYMDYIQVQKRPNLGNHKGQSPSDSWDRSPEGVWDIGPGQSTIKASTEGCTKPAGPRLILVHANKKPGSGLHPQPVATILAERHSDLADVTRLLALPAPARLVADPLALL
jgi:hypothetical protein